MEELFSDFPILIAQNGPLLGQRWGIKAETHIGRDPDCEIVVPDRKVSRVHARIKLNNNGVLLEDLGSKNSTFLNGALLETPTILEEGDIIQIALVQSFFFLSSDATMPLDQKYLSNPQTDLKPKKLYLDYRSRRVWLGDQEILPPLSVPQFRLLHTLNEQQGKVVSRGDLIAVIWGDEKAVGVSEQALDALVRRLRDRLSLYDTSHEYLVTVRGHGIRLDNNPGY